MQEKDLVKMLEPIKEHISRNAKVINIYDVPKIVDRFFPSIETLKEIADYLKNNLPGYSSLTPEKRLERTKTILRDALNSSALIHFNSVKDEEFVEGFSEEEIENEFKDLIEEDDYDNFYCDDED